MREAEAIAASRRTNSLTLSRHTEILEVLEIPQLMDTCVRNGYYEEALELAAYVRRLERKHAAIPVIQVGPREGGGRAPGQAGAARGLTSPLPPCPRARASWRKCASPRS